MRRFPSTQAALGLLGAWAGWGVVEVKGQFAAPPGVETWCGKAYKATNASFDPGGRMEAPKRSDKPLLNLQVYPRMNIYLEDETMGSLVVDAGLSWTTGVKYCDQTKDDNARFTFEVSVADTGARISEKTDISVNSTGNEIPMSLLSLPARTEPYTLLIKTSSPNCAQNMSTKTQVYKLPKRTDGGSVTKLDNLYGGLLVQERLQNGSTSWKSIFPYSFYVDWGGYLSDPANLTAFANLGYNIVHPTPGGGPVPFDPAKFEIFLNKLDELGLWLMYDMRWTFKNLSLVNSQIEQLRARKSVLLWYTGDEPDGTSDPLNSTVLAYDLIKKLDPYHPTSLVLNCDNYFYAEYAKGADIILTDPYPIAQNATFSTQWNTPCNSTYGDCGCDGCNGNFRDVSTRMDRLKQYQEWIGGPKTFWGVPQGFGGSEYWARPPTRMEEVVMAMLFVNHGAKGIVAWNFPTTQELTQVTSSLAKTLSAPDITGLLLGAKPVVLAVEGQVGGDLDVTGWKVGGKMLISIVHVGLANYVGSASINLPAKAKSGVRQIWPAEGSTGWAVKDGVLSKSGLGAMEVSILVLDVA
ncbi:putative glycoside hydrolase subgroup catalytic core [Venturia nashicola]|uniref:Putative glycoside hydrolase subgroup catalytic core n=1 Tax=Venturia nashicola TaxID=86259 RepID=A0A4Z1NFE7_9PEZI|nr:putative glycoside hydrolase subgroup catalytic core [Venturia nashicola]